MTLFSYQPKEDGLLFGDQSIRKINPVVANNMEIFPATTGDGQVLVVNNLVQFLSVATKTSKPLVIKLFSQNNRQDEAFQELANKFKDTAAFMSMDAAINASLVNLFIYMLRIEGALSKDREPVYPLFLFCQKDFVSLLNGMINFKKNSLKLLDSPGLENKEQLEVGIKKALAGKFENIEKQDFSTDNQNENKENEWKKWQNKGKDLFDKVKNWFKTKVLGMHLSRKIA